MSIKNYEGLFSIGHFPPKLSSIEPRSGETGAAVARVPVFELSVRQIETSCAGARTRGFIAHTSPEKPTATTFVTQFLGWVVGIGFAGLALFRAPRLPTLGLDPLDEREPRVALSTTVGRGSVRRGRILQTSGW